MNQHSFQIVPYQEEYKHQLIKVWEQSVLASHYFLCTSDFAEIKELVKNIDFNDLSVFCLLQQNTMAGFIGVADRKVEMLFLAPQFFGKGLGKRLMDFATHQLQANAVDVNEQNKIALNFYIKLGFEVYDRSEKDGQGKNYPILKMRLAQKY